MLDSREPPRGDFVAYVEKIEREQLVRAMQPHRLAHLAPAGSVVTDGVADDKSSALSTFEAQRLLQAPKTQGKSGAGAPLGAMVGVVIGAALVAFGFMTEGGFFFVILGAALLWHNLRKLRRSTNEAGSPAHQVDRAFGRNPAADSQKRNA